jgi:acylphosphatase
MSAARFIVRGKVQGVWFRASTREQAARLGLDGHARNLGDGSVEVIAIGDAEALDAHWSAGCTWARRWHGSMRCRVLRGRRIHGPQAAASQSPDPCMSLSCTDLRLRYARIGQGMPQGAA